MPEIISAVAIVESPDEYVVQRRPNLPGRLAYPGKLQLLGGHVEPGEDPAEAVVRELGEETDLDPAQLDAEFLWSGPVVGQDKHGQPVQRQVNLFDVAVPSTDFQLGEAGALVVVRKEIEAVRGLTVQFTDFALWALTQHVRRQPWR